MKIRFAAPFGLLAALAVGGTLLGGCGSGAEPDTSQQQKNLETAQNMRSYFDKSGGDFESLSEVDKAAYIQLSGGEEKARQNWELMKNGPGAFDRSGAGGGAGR